MPKSRHRKKPAPTKTVAPNRVSFSSFKTDGERHDAFKQAMLQAAEASAAEFPGLVGILHNLLRVRTPAGLLSTFGFHGSRATIGLDGATRAFSKDIGQHHIELLQALILMLPAADWGHGPPTPYVMQVLFETVPKLAFAFVQMRMAEWKDEPDASKRAALFLQEKMRLHTQAVRNWGYYGEVIRISRELYSPLDERFIAGAGFSANDLIDLAEILVTEIERRSGKHVEAMRPVMRGKTVYDVVSQYYQRMPELRGTPEQFMAMVAAGTSREQVLGWVLSQSDLRHLDMMTFTVADVAELIGKPSGTVERILDALSLRPGALVGQKVEHLFLANPVWARPGIKLADGYLFVIPQAIFSHINEIMRSLAAAADSEDRLTSRRATYLEGKMVETLQSALPTARIIQNAKWTSGDQRFETDAIVVADRTLIIAEAKSHRVTPQGLRGAPDRMKRHLTDLVINPSIQSERLAGLVMGARAGDQAARVIIGGLGIDAAAIDDVVRISVTLDDLSVLSSSEGELAEVGWIPEGHSVAPSMHIADLICVAEVLENELLFVHYLAERFHFQKQFNLLGDELDFLGLYLSTGFDFGPQRDDSDQMLISGMSGPIDRFYDGRDAGLKVPKPRANLSPTYRAILDRLVERKPAGWSSIGIHLLNSAGPDEQKTAERGLLRLRKSVLRNSKVPGHECFMTIVHPSKRKAMVGFYVYRDAEKDRRRDRMERLALEALEDQGVRACVVFGRNADRWIEPYEAVLLMQGRLLLL